MEDILKQVPLFQTLYSEELNRAQTSGLIRQVHFKKNTVIHIPDDTVLYYDVIAKGSVHIQHIGKDGKQISITYMHPFSAIGVNLLFSSSKKHEMLIEAVSDTLLLRIEKSLIIELAQSNEAFMIMLMRQIADRSKFLAQRLKTLSTSSLREKIVDYLYSLYLQQQANPVILPSTKQAWADSLGVARSSLVRELKKMKNEALLSWEGSSIVIFDPLLKTLPQ